MKLLDKREVQKGKTLDRKLEISEGAKLAKKVDDLRKLAAEEQSNLIKFRNESLKKVQDEIDKNIDERNSLLSEISQLQREKILLKIPLDSEWEKVKEEAERVEKIQFSLRNLERGLDDRASAITQNEVSIETDKARIADMMKSTSEILSKAETKEKEAEKILSESKQIFKDTDVKCKAKIAILKLKETDLNYKEVDLNSLKVNLEKREKEITNEKLLLKDERETLKRAFERLKK